MMASPVALDSPGVQLLLTRFMLRELAPMCVPQHTPHQRPHPVPSGQINTARRTGISA